jgi:hypothetical protein
MRMMVVLLLLTALLAVGVIDSLTETALAPHP